MGVPLITTFLPQILITIILGVVSIVIFTGMHDSAITESMRNSLSGSMEFVEERISGPFSTLRQNARLLVENIKRNDANAYRGDDSPVFLSVPNTTNVEALRVPYQEMRSMIADSNGTYAFIYQQYRAGRKTGTSPTSNDPKDFQWGWSGVASTYAWHYTNGADQVIWSEGYNYPDWETSDMYDWNEDTDGSDYVNGARYLAQSNASDGRYIALTAYADKQVDGSFVLYATFTYALPISYHPTTGFATNSLLMDIDCGKWMVQFVTQMNIPATQVTVVQPSDMTIVASSFGSLAPGYNCPNASDATTCVLWTAATIPEKRLRDAFAAFDSLVGLAYTTTIKEPKGSSDIYSARPIRKAGLDLVAVGVTERDHFYADGKRASRDAIITCVMLVVATIVVAVVTAVLLSRPLSDLGYRMALTASMEDDVTELQKSTVSQIGDMQQAYLMMKSELNRMKSFLPQSLLTNDNEDDCDDDEGSQAQSVGSSSKVSEVISDNHSRSSRASKRTSNSSGHRSGVAAVVRQLNTSRSTLNKRVAIAVFNLVGFLSSVRDAAGQKATKLQSEFLRIVIDAAKGERGIVDSFSGDHIVVSWNAVTNVASPAKRAAQAAVEVKKVVMQRPHMPLVSAGIAQGQALVGNMGTDDMVKFNLIGSVFTHAAVLERMAAKRAKAANKCSILVSPSAAVDIDLNFFLRATSIMTLHGNDEPTVIYSLETPRSAGANDEWMYELQNSEALDPFQAINSLYMSLLEGDEQQFNELFDKAPEDVRAELTEVKASLTNTKQI